LSFLDILLGNEPVFEPKKRIYQRLLAGDQEEAAELLDEYLEHQPLVEVYDTVLIPALALAETHWQRGELNEAKHKFIMQSLREMIQDESSDCLVQALPATSTVGEIFDLVERRQPDVVCISATPPAAVMHARYLSKQLRSRFPRLNLVVGLWDAQGDLSKSRERIGCGAVVAATLAAAQAHIRQMAPAALPRREKHAPSEADQPVETGTL
jgi:hypothetical protein